MLRYPTLSEIPSSREVLDKFKGYNHNLRIGDGEFYDMKNLSADNYPVLSQRKKRGTYLTTNTPNGMCSNTKFCYVDGQDFYIGGNKYDLKLTNTSKDLVSIGARVVIMPDQKYINTVNLSDTGHMRAGLYDLPKKDFESYKQPELLIYLAFQYYNYDTLVYMKSVLIVRKGEQLPYIDGTNQSQYPAYAIAWDNSNSRYYCYHKVVLGEKCSWETGWANNTGFSDMTDDNVYIIIYGYNDDKTYYKETIDKIYSETGNGTIKLSGLPCWYNENPSIFPCSTVSFPNGALGVLAFKSMNSADLSSTEVTNITNFIDWLIGASGSEFKYRRLGTPITVETPESKKSTVPKLDHLIESGNRLWGCRYGENNNGEFVNEIYATVLGDFKNWVKNDGISTDAWAASVGTSGEFTGAINFGGKPIFFKEDCMHRVYGEYVPFSMQMTPCKGVQKGCHKSLAIVNDVLYYKSRTGICAYDGSLPVEISTNFGDKQYYNAVGGSIGNKYYISMQDEAGEWHLFVYDTVKRMWHKEDNTQVTQFCNHQGELYYIDHADHYIHSVKGTGVQETTPIPWSAETGILGATTPDNKYVTRIDVRMAVSKGSKMSMHIEYDSMGEWERLMEIEGLTLNTFTIPVIPRRCDHFRIKLEGEGDVKIFSITKTLEDAE